MKTLLLYFLIFILFGEVVTLYLIKKEQPQDKILAETTVSSTPFVSPKPTAKAETPVPLATPKPSAKDGQPTFSSQQINGFIDRFAGQYGVSPDVLRYIALCESGFNPKASHVGYAGLFQFGPVTWKYMRAQMGEDTNINLRFNAEEAVQTAAYAISIGDSKIWPHCYP
jgi:hypothetical protein